MRTWMAAVLGGLVLLAGAGGCGKDGGGGKVKVRLATVLPADHPSCEALGFFRDRLAEVSGGQVDVQLFLNSQLGGDAETIEFCQAGNIEMVYTSSASLAQHAAMMNVVCLPYMFDDMEHLHRAMDGEVGKALAAELEEIGLRPLCWFDAGTRNVMTKKGPVPEPADLEGLKIRVQQSSLMIDTLNAMGAAATPMGQGEVYTSLQTGRLDGWENNPATCESFKMYETGCRYFTWTQHLAIPDAVVINAGFLGRQSPEVQGWIEQVAAETTAKQRDLWATGEAAIVAELKEAGMEFSQADRAAYAERVKRVYPTYYAKYGAEFEALCKQIEGMK
ncbi:MAG: TRAP transporter substrate-binding protein [Sedimentisphaerales bacterium]|nr:TRAP transporter substrate-binding protein [Sedimentisphaerales bacterium]